MQQVDLIIIGSGPGGYETAVKAAKSGLTTIVVEDQHAGGTCLNEGCIPTKCFCRHAEMLKEFTEAEAFGITNANYQFDFSKVISRKNEVVATLKGGVETLMKTPGITFIEGKASFVDAHTIKVEGSDEQYKATNIIIATGSVTKFLPIEGAHLPGVLTSTEILDIDHVPARLCVIGGGVIGLEFASIFKAFGSDVTVLEFCKEILPNFDSDIAKRLKTSLKQRGINCINQAAVCGIQKAEDGTFRVSYESKGKTLDVEADTVLMAVGRAANTESLNLADIHIEFTKRGITVDENMQTNIPGVYAVGDVNGLCQLAHAATYQGIRALNHILGKADQLRLDVIPAAVFTLPEAACVGKSEDVCKAEGIDYTVGKGFFRANGKALAMGQTEGLVKLISEKESGKILGCHMFGPHAADLIQEVATLMTQNGTVTHLRETVHAHPTLCEVVLSAAQ